MTVTKSSSCIKNKVAESFGKYASKSCKIIYNLTLAAGQKLLFNQSFCVPFFYKYFHFLVEIFSLWHSKFPSWNLEM